MLELSHRLPTDVSGPLRRPEDSLQLRCHAVGSSLKGLTFTTVEPAFLPLHEHRYVPEQCNYSAVDQPACSEVDRLQ
jgi:hypothetical protein